MIEAVYWRGLAYTAADGLPVKGGRAGLEKQRGREGLWRCAGGVWAGQQGKPTREWPGSRHGPRPAVSEAAAPNVNAGHGTPYRAGNVVQRGERDLPTAYLLREVILPDCTVSCGSPLRRVTRLGLREVIPKGCAR